MTSVFTFCALSLLVKIRTFIYKLFCQWNVNSAYKVQNVTGCRKHLAHTLLACSWRAPTVCSDDKHARVGASQPLFMFVFRVLLGRAYVCREPKQFKRPPCTDTGCCSDTCSKHSLYDSVIGTHNFNGSFLGLGNIKVAIHDSLRVIFVISTLCSTEAS